MKIISLTAENIKKLRAVEITPTGDVVTISGKNGSGKTSLLDSIFWALAGTSHIQGQPIRKGETKARIKLDLGELIVERKFTPAGSTLTVETAAGARYQSPQKMLDALLGELSFDPLAFARMEPRKQFDELRRVAKLEVDTEQLDALNKGDYAKRADANRDAKARRAQADAIAVPADTPDAPVSEDGLLAEIEAAVKHNADIETRKAKREQVQQAIVSLKNQAAETKARAAKLREQAVAEEAAAKAKIEEAAAHEDRLKQAPALAGPVDLAELRAKLQTAKTANGWIAKREVRTKLVADAKALETQANDFTAQMEAREKAKHDAIAAAAMPVPGLGLGDGEITLNGIPFDQASSAEQLKVSMGIAMAANPKLRIIRIMDGSLLDTDSMRIVGEMAKATDFQVWCEVVDSSGKLGIVIDDGAVVAQEKSA